MVYLHLVAQDLAVVRILYEGLNPSSSIELESLGTLELITKTGKPQSNPTWDQIAQAHRQYGEVIIHYTPKEQNSYHL